MANFTPTEEYAIRAYAVIEMLIAEGNLDEEEVELFEQLQDTAPVEISLVGLRLYQDTK